MNHSPDPAEESLEAFIEEVLAGGQIWGLASNDGWAICASSDDDTIDVYPFWSNEADAALHCVGEWSIFWPVALTLEDFLEDWLPGMDQDEVLAGTNWNEDLEGLEVEPAYLAEALNRRINSH